MEYTTEKQNEALIIHLKGRLDANSAPDFEAAGPDLMSGSRHLILDGADLDYISSAGLRVVLAMAKKMKSSGSALSLCNLQKMVHEVFTVSGFASYIPIHENIEAALAAE